MPNVHAWLMTCSKLKQLRLLVSSYRQVCK